MTVLTVSFASRPIDFGPEVTLDPTSFVVFIWNDADVDLSGGGWIDLSDAAWRDWSDDTVALNVVWSTASKPDETED